MAFAPAPRQRRAVQRKVTRGALAQQHYAKRAHLFANERYRLNPHLGEYPQLAGISLKGIGKAIGKAAKQVGHAVGKVASSKVVKGVVGGALALTGVGIPASAAIMGGIGAAGGALKKGGGLKQALKGAGTGVATGVVAGGVGKVLPKVPGFGGITSKAQAIGRKIPVFSKVVPKAPSVTGGLLRKTGGILTKTATTTFDATRKVDALLDQPLPQVGITPSGEPIVTTMPVEQTAPDVAVMQQSAVDKIKAAARRAAQRAKAQAEKAARDAVAAQVSAVTTPPSANGTAPQGGFPAMPAPAFQEPQTAEQQAAQKAGFMDSPLALPAIAGIALYALSRK